MDGNSAIGNFDVSSGVKQGLRSCLLKCHNQRVVVEMIKLHSAESARASKNSLNLQFRKQHPV